jgi:xanthine dehydrogenase YagR molybdenum-binding subunit
MTTTYAMNEVHPTSAVDRGVQGVLGKPLDRIDGPVKVAGAATYSVEHDMPGLVHGYPVVAQHGSGRITTLDASAARAMPGVIDVIVGDRLIPRQTPLWGGGAQDYDGTLWSYGEIVGLAIADSFEAARAAARAVTIAAEPDPDRKVDIFAVETESAPPGSLLTDVTKGDLDAAMADAPVAVDVTYTTPRQVHAAMEPHGAIAQWDGDRLTVHGQFQLIGTAIQMLAKSLDILPDNIRLLTPYMGGGFGGKVMTADAILAAVGAKRVGRPVKVVLPRRQIFHACYGRTDTHQRIRLAADRDGRLLGIGQDSLVAQKVNGSGFEPVALGALSLYAGAHRSFTQRIAKLNLTAHGPVRAPGEAVGMMGLECAMDELAEALDLDPIELRRRNEPEMDPTNGKPFSSRRLLDCFEEGARRFGWERHAPGSRRQGDWLIGTGMATAARVNFLSASAARVRLEGDRVTIETDMTDIGTGSYTILAQVAGEALGVPVERITVRLGDSNFPRAAGSGGSAGGSSSTSSVLLACEEIVGELAKRVGAPDVQEMTLKDGHVITGNRRIPLSELAAEPIEAEGRIEPGANNRRFSQATHGAQFAEVWVNAVTGETRVKRMLAVFDCGRVLNHKTARSQAIGGMIWGLGYALHEEAHVDRRTGQYANGDLGEYLIPTQADVPQIEAYFVEEIDRVANPVGAKGLGELGISGAGAAVANAIYNACGVRVREFPITCDKLLAGLPDL